MSKDYYKKVLTPEEEAVAKQWMAGGASAEVQAYIHLLLEDAIREWSKEDENYRDMP